MRRNASMAGQSTSFFGIFLANNDCFGAQPAQVPWQDTWPCSSSKTFSGFKSLHELSKKDKLKVQIAFRIFLVQQVIANHTHGMYKKTSLGCILSSLSFHASLTYLLVKEPIHLSRDLTAVSLRIIIIISYTQESAGYIWTHLCQGRLIKCHNIQYTILRYITWSPSRKLAA